APTVPGGRWRPEDGMQQHTNVERYRPATSSAKAGPAPDARCGTPPPSVPDAPRRHGRRRVLGGGYEQPDAGPDLPSASRTGLLRPWPCASPSTRDPTGLPPIPLFLF